MSDVIYGWLLILKKIQSNSIFTSQNLGMKYIIFSPNNLKKNFGFIHAHIYCDVICRTIRLPLDFACCISIPKIWNYIKRYRYTTKDSRSLKSLLNFFKILFGGVFKLSLLQDLNHLAMILKQAKIFKKVCQMELKKISRDYKKIFLL